MERNRQPGIERCNSPPEGSEVSTTTEVQGFSLFRGLRRIVERVKHDLRETDDSLVVDASVYGGASDHPCDIWISNDEVPTSSIYDDYVRLAEAEASRLSPGISRDDG